MKLNILGFSLAMGITWSFGILLLGAWVMVMDFNDPSMGILSQMYLGYKARPLGDIIGFVWAFGDSFIFGLIFSSIYNFYVSWASKRK